MTKLYFVVFRLNVTSTFDEEVKVVVTLTVRIYYNRNRDDVIKQRKGSD